MAIIYKWHIENMARNTADGGVFEVYFRCTGFDGDYQDTVTGVVTMEPDPDADGFTPYSDLTEAQVLGWVKAEVSESETQQLVADNIAERKNPTIEVSVPWNTNPSED